MPIPSNIERYTRSSTRDKVLAQLQRWVIEGTLKPGEKLYDVELAEAMQVSRTPIREAFQIMEHQGFVDLIPGKETRVTRIDKEDVFKIYPPLAMLESLNAQEATTRVNFSALEELKKINHEFRQALEERNSFEAMELDRHFHSVIAEVAENPYVTSFTNILHMHASRLKYIFFQHLILPAYMSVDEHEMIIHAFEERNRDSAFEVMKKNWLRPMEEIANSLNK
ncbi:MAG: GntR family transcriptional regulator [Bacilli bacterium]